MLSWYVPLLVGSGVLRAKGQGGVFCFPRSRVYVRWESSPCLFWIQQKLVYCSGISLHQVWLDHLHQLSICHRLIFPVYKQAARSSMGHPIPWHSSYLRAWPCLAKSFLKIKVRLLNPGCTSENILHHSQRPCRNSDAVGVIPYSVPARLSCRA